MMKGRKSTAGVGLALLLGHARARVELVLSAVSSARTMGAASSGTRRERVAREVGPGILVGASPWRSSPSRRGRCPRCRSRFIATAWPGRVRPEGGDALLLGEELAQARVEGRRRRRARRRSRRGCVPRCSTTSRARVEALDARRSAGSRTSGASRRLLGRRWSWACSCSRSPATGLPMVTQVLVREVVPDRGGCHPRGAGAPGPSGRTVASHARAEARGPLRPHRARPRARARRVCRAAAPGGQGHEGRGGGPARRDHGADHGAPGRDLREVRADPEHAAGSARARGTRGSSRACRTRCRRRPSPR